MKKNQSNIDISIIIVSWNVRELLLGSIESVMKYTRNYSYEIIVVDNNSSDNSVNAIRERFPNVKILANLDNKGFGSANNQGAKIAKGKYLLFLNPDTEFDYDVISSVMSNMRRFSATLISPEQFNGRRKLIIFSASYSTLQLHLISILEYFLSFFSKPYKIWFKKVFKVPSVSGAFMLVKKKDFVNSGMFNDRNLLYFEDIYLCRRIRGNGGTVMFDRKNYFIHYHGQSTKQYQSKHSLFIKSFCSYCKNK